ncbi:uncharacterized protein LOC144439235 [Glandiceps talaboti]
MAVNLPKCTFCGLTKKVLKRCTGCRDIFYCSRECQIKDWPGHRLNCVGSSDKDNMATMERKSTDLSATQNSSLQTPRQRNESMQSSNSSAPNCDDTGNSDCKETTSLPSVGIRIKHNKEKHALKVLITEDGEKIMEQISDFLHIPVDRLKLIHKGKMANKDNIKELVKEKAVFQAVGEVAESEDNLVKSDIDIICDQISVDRNTAIKALRKTGDVVDAIFLITEGK